MKNSRNCLNAISRIVLPLCMTASLHAYADMNQSQAFDLGKLSGSESNISSLLSLINSASAVNNVKGYNPAPAEKNNWSGAQTPIGAILSAGSSKISSCVTNSNDGSPAGIQHCEAVKSMEGVKNFNPKSVIDYSDPLIQKGNGITANPDTIAGQNPGTYTACTEETIFIKPKFLLETCDDWSEELQAACKAGREVIVDKDTNYACKETLSTISRSTCTYGRLIAVDQTTKYQCNKSVSTYGTGTCHDYVTPLLTGAYNVLTTQYPCYSQPVEVTYDTVAGTFLYRLNGMGSFETFNGVTPWSKKTYATCWRNEGEAVRITSINPIPSGTLQTFCFQDSSRYGGKCKNAGVCCIQAYASGIVFTVEGWDAFHGVRFNWTYSVDNTGLPSTYSISKSTSTTCGAYR